MSKSCPNCSHELRAGAKTWHLLCPTCRYEGSTLGVAINVAGVKEQIDEDTRGDALREIRAANFDQLLRLVVPLTPSPQSGEARPRLLDIGAGHGWFVEAAAKHYHARGIEPDEGARVQAANNGVELIPGLFPDCLAENDRVEVITFNDSLEHMPDVGMALKAAFVHLTSGGLAVVNLPNAGGFFYQLSRCLDKLGWTGPFERMWQVGLPSPHLHYFRADNLQGIARQAGFELVAQQSLESIRFKGLYARIAYARRGARVSSGLMWLATLPLLPIVKVAPSDIMVLVFRKP